MPAIPRAMAIARNLAHNLARNTNWVARGTMGEPEATNKFGPVADSPGDDVGKYVFSFQDAHTTRLYRVVVEEIDLRGNRVLRAYPGDVHSDAAGRQIG